MVCREAAGLEHDTVKATERRCGGLLHFLNNGANETKLGQEIVFSIEMLKTLGEYFFYKNMNFCGQNYQKSKKRGHKFPT